MLKIIANPHIFKNFSELDPSDNNYLKGIDLLGSDISWMKLAQMQYH